MKMVITLKSGVQIKADVEDCTVGRSQVFGELRDLKWTSTERPGVRIGWLDMGEVAAVHAEFDWDGADADPLPPSSSAN
jgi:hypothetical protein